MSLRVHQTVDEFDTTEITVTGTANGVDGNIYILAYHQPTEDEEESDYWLSSNITAGGSASNLQSAIKDYYKQSGVAGTDPVVTMTKCQDELDNEVDCEADSETTTIVKYTYEIVVPRSISEASSVFIYFIPLDTSAMVTITLPDALGKRSQAPLSGTYQIVCYELDGYARITDPISISHNANHVYNFIKAACPNLADRFSVV